MSDPYYVLVAGSGETSRANVEALMDDHYYANGNDGTLVLSFIKKPTQGQIYAAQFAKDKDKKIVVFCDDEAEVNAIPNSAEKNRTSSPVTDAIALISGKISSAFLLWNDEDEESLELLNGCKKAEVPCFNLTDGLLTLTAVKGAGKPVAPIMPEIETTTSDSFPYIPEYELDEEEEEDEEETEEEESFEETVMDALYGLARMIAATVIEQLTEDFDVKPKDKK